MKTDALTHKKILIVGAGVTGVSVAKFLSARGINFDVADERAVLPDEMLRVVPDLQHFTVLDSELTANYDVLVLSPGVPRAHPAIAAAISLEKPVVGDIELFAGVVEQPVIAVTGSNGKSTVVSMLAHVLKTANRSPVLCGNIGKPALDAFSESVSNDLEHALFVLELSSYQLESTRSLAPFTACVLNISDDHMDRYDSIDHYAQVKQHIYHNAKHIVANWDDPLTHPVDLAVQKATYFSLTSEQSLAHLGQSAEGRELICANDAVMAADDLLVPGQHNVANALAVLALLEPLQLDHSVLRDGLASFRGLQHRTELIAVLDDVRYYNDSKGTNVDACAHAIGAMGSPVILIAGGQGKGADFTPLFDVVSEHVKDLVLIGEDRHILSAVLAGAANVHFADSMTEAVALSSSLASAGDAVLLSPACASFDMFKNFEARGLSFTAAVEALVA